MVGKDSLELCKTPQVSGVLAQLKPPTNTLTISAVKLLSMDRIKLFDSYIRLVYWKKHKD